MSASEHVTLTINVSGFSKLQRMSKKNIKRMKKHTRIKEATKKNISYCRLYSCCQSEMCPCPWRFAHNKVIVVIM
jgi:hypothetical protein